MSCCTDPKTVTKLSFLEAKAMNFKKYIETYSPDAEVQKYIDTFRPELLVQTLTTVVVPIVQTAQIETSINELVKHLTIPDDQLETVKKKLKAYLQMFNDVLLE